MGKNLINILIISQDVSLIETIRDFTRKTEGLNLINKEIDLDNLLSTISEAKPDVILMDFHLTKDPDEINCRNISHIAKDRNNYCSPTL